MPHKYVVYAAVVLVLLAVSVELTALVVSWARPLRLARWLLIAGAAGLLAAAATGFAQSSGQVPARHAALLSIHRWFAGVSVALGLLTAASQLARRAMREQLVSVRVMAYLLTGMLVTISVMYGRALANGEVATVDASNRLEHQLSGGSTLGPQRKRVPERKQKNNEIIQVCSRHGCIGGR